MKISFIHNLPCHEKDNTVHILNAI